MQGDRRDTHRNGVPRWLVMPLPGAISLHPESTPPRISSTIRVCSAHKRDKTKILLRWLAPPVRRFHIPTFCFTRGWDKLVAVLFHGTWTQESQHAVSLLESLAHQHHQPEQQEPGRHQSSSPAVDRGSSTAAETPQAGADAAVQRASGGFQVLLAEANVMSLIDVRGALLLL